MSQEKWACAAKFLSLSEAVVPFQDSQLRQLRVRNVFSETFIDGCLSVVCECPTAIEGGPDQGAVLAPKLCLKPTHHLVFFEQLKILRGLLRVDPQSLGLAAQREEFFGRVAPSMVASAWFAVSN